MIRDLFSVTFTDILSGFHSEEGRRERSKEKGIGLGIRMAAEIKQCII
jgi:hypothetical protein